jgi:hypothetical protein
MAVYGADVEQLRALAKIFTDAGQRLTTATSTVTAQVQSSPWRGPDAEQFRSNWAGRYSAQLAVAARLLDQNATALIKNADDQELASTDDGSGSGSGSNGSGSNGSGSGPSPSGPLPAVPSDGSSTDDVRDWWNDLSPEEQQRYIDEQPGVIGALDGVPASVRDEANRHYLESELARLQSLPTPADDAEAQELVRAIDVLENAQKVLADTEDSHLLLLDTTSGDPVKVAISVGDVDSADHVGVFTQGMDSRADTPTGLTGPVANMVALRNETDSQLYEEGKDETTAMVVWMGYDSPQGAEVANPGYGLEGGVDLAAFGDGIRSNNENGHLTALGHSYGSYTTGIALQQTDAFDDFVAFGSPGLGTSDVSDLRVSSGDVYVLEADWDPVADLGYFGTDTNQLSGVTNLSADAQAGMGGSSGHSEYLVDRSTAQYNMAAIVGGNEDNAITGSNWGAGDVIRGSQYLNIDVPRNIATTVVETANSVAPYLRYGWEAATGIFG